MKFLERNGKLYMKVEPRSFLRNSRTLIDIEQRRDFLVVDLETGELWPWKREFVEQIKVGRASEFRPYYQPEPGQKSIRLSDDIDVLRVQIHDQFVLGHTTGRFWYTDFSGDRRFVDSQGRLESFLKNIDKAYRGEHGY
jgi:hypothetical protein